eukprot:14896813-Alexandrium_andersonii.AAC.1
MRRSTGTDLSGTGEHMYHARDSTEGHLETRCVGSLSPRAPTHLDVGLASESNRVAIARRI